MSGPVRLASALGAHTAAIVLANVLTARFGLVPVGFGLMVTAGTYAAGLALLARDFVHRYGGWKWALVGVGTGIALSWFLATPALALASAAAFGLAEFADLVVFSRLRRRGFVPAALASNAVGAPIDTVVFLAVAGFPLSWPLMLGQFIGKVLWATVVPLALYVGGRHALLREPIHTQGA